MAQRLGNLDKWIPIEGDRQRGLFFPGDARKVTLDVVTGEPVRLYVEYEVPPDEAGQGGGTREQLLTVVNGRDSVEFTVGGDFTLFASGGDALVYTIDGQEVHNVDIAPVIFTRIASRKVRNPNLEMMEYQMKLNLQRRMEQLELEAAARLKDTVNRYAAQRSPRTPPAAVGQQPASEDAGGEGTEPRAADAGSGTPAKGGKGGAKPKPAAAAADD